MTLKCRSTPVSLPFSVLCATLLAFVGVATDPSESTTSQPLASILQKLSSEGGLHDASLWRQLGKLQLDAGEFAEARRIFCFGSKCCPDDPGLKHHVQVYEAFHGSVESDTRASLPKTNSDLPPPPLVLPKDLEFLSLEVPSDAIPESVLKHPKGSSPPNERARLVHASKEPIFPLEACRYLIHSAAKTVANTENTVKWTKDRHVQAPTCDVPLFSLEKDTQAWVRDAFHTALFPLLSQVIAPELDVNPSQWRVQDCFVVRYDATEQDGPGFASLKPHQDESLLSLTIALNEMDQDYQEGGLFLASTQDVLNGPAGTVLCFAGGLVHGGFPVRSGTRWILTVFLYVDQNQSGRTPGYTLEEIKALRNAR